MIDLANTDLRDNWTEEDLRVITTNTRWLAYMDAQAHDERMGAITSSELYPLIYKRRFSELDFDGVYHHPRDLAITGRAYREMLGEFARRVLTGRIELPENLRVLHPDIYLYEPESYRKAREEYDQQEQPK